MFRASSYDELVDAPNVLGSFTVARFDGKPHFIVRAPADSVHDDAQDKITAFRKIVLTERAIFGSLPYDKYVFFGVVQNGGAIEHANSFVGGIELDDVNAAHEFFHLWNVKRIRPAELWPCDYSRVRTGPSLWVSEGITSYYQNLVAYRAGFAQFADVPSDGPVPTTRSNASGEAELLAELGYRIGVFEGADARHTMSPSDASWSDALGYGAASPSYYLSGELLGALLDLSILHDTNGKRRLDDVMRALYEQYFTKGKGFTADDLVHTVSATTGRDYRGFFAR